MAAGLKEGALVLSLAAAALVLDSAPLTLGLNGGIGGMLANRGAALALAGVAVSSFLLEATPAGLRMFF